MAMYWSWLAPRQKHILEILLRQPGEWTELERCGRNLYTLRTLERRDLVQVGQEAGRLFARSTARARRLARRQHGRREIGSAQCALAIRMAHDGHTYPQIAAALGVSAGTAYRIAAGHHPAAVAYMADTGASPAPVRKRRYPDSLRQRCIQLRRAGMSLDQIAEVLRVPRTTVGGWLRRGGLASHRRLSDAEVRRCLQMARSGWSVTELCSFFGRSRPTIYRVLRLEKVGLAEKMLESA